MELKMLIPTSTVIVWRIAHTRKKNNHSNSGPSEGEDLETGERSPRKFVLVAAGDKDQETKKARGGMAGPL